jgi:hypothetical protein
VREWVARALLAAVCWAPDLAAQTRAIVTDRGPGASGRILAEALAGPHRLIEPDSSRFVVRRADQERTSLVVLGRTAVVDGIVEGDVIVVGGDLFVHPGARITGRAIAIGGGVYASALAIVFQGSTSFRDDSFSIERTPAGYALAYRSLITDTQSPVVLPGFYGLRLPTYDRVNGASIAAGAAILFAKGRGELQAVATYRSDLGKVDPAIAGSFQLSRAVRLQFLAERGTFSNDAWIWSNFVNSLSSLALGTDTRNYYRADRADGSIHRLWQWTASQVEPTLGVRAERVWGVGPVPGELRGPWSILGRRDTLSGMWRPNPFLPDGEIFSLLAGGTVRWTAGGVHVRASSILERSLAVSGPGGAAADGFSQLTSDGGVTFLTFGEQEYAVDVHWVISPGEATPPQRFVYFGGAGTMPFLELLEQGGDELLLVDQRYSVPLSNIRLRFLGIPTVQLRHRLGSAGLGDLPAFEQVLSLGVQLTIIRVELQRHVATGRTRVGAGLTFSR